jgi:methionyl aminopeptidase
MWSVRAFVTLVIFEHLASAFFLDTIPPPRHHGFTSSSSCRRGASLSGSALFMNNKKKPKKSVPTKQASRGFGDGSTMLKDSFPYSGSIRPFEQSPQRVVVDESIELPDYALDGTPKKGKSSPLLPWIIEVKKPDEIIKMKESGKLARTILDLAGRMVQPGVTTDEIDAAVHDAIVAAGAYPSPLNYHGFPKSCCTSVNEVICHGIPDTRPLQEGDVVNMDITVYLNGYHGDCSEMFVAGEPDENARHLLQTTYDCWIQACQYVKPGRDYKDLGAIMEDYITPKGFSTVRNFCGHGIGSVFHTTPNILHYRNNEPNGQMAAGHTFTIEPMICEGSSKVLSWPDDWTATTVDAGRSAQFEHTLLITEDGVEALTGKNENSMLQFWEKESEIYKGFFLGTSQAARQRAEEINSKLNL